MKAHSSASISSGASIAAKCPLKHVSPTHDIVRLLCVGSRRRYEHRVRECGYACGHFLPRVRRHLVQAVLALALIDPRCGHDRSGCHVEHNIGQRYAVAVSSCSVASEISVATLTMSLKLISDRTTPEFCAFCKNRAPSSLVARHPAVPSYRPVPSSVAKPRYTFMYWTSSSG